MTRAEALTHAIREINRHYWCSGGSPKHTPAIEILAQMRTETYKEVSNEQREG